MYDDGTDTSCFGMCNGKAIVISFGGTRSKKNLITDVKVKWVRPFVRYQDIKVRHGFNKVLLKVLERVRIFIYRCREKYDKHKSLGESNMPLFLTGHSLGGALATLSLAYFTINAQGLDDEEPVHAVYTFAQPSVGNQPFCDTLKTAAGKTIFYRVTNKKDIVPRMRSKHSRHYGIHIHIAPDMTLHQVPEAKDHDKPIKPKDARGMISVNDHHCRVYPPYILHNSCSHRRNL